MLALAACDNPSDYLPKQAPGAAAPTPPSLADVQALRTVLRSCERAMEAGSDDIAQIAASAQAPPQPTLILKARDSCASAAEAIGRLPIWGRLKDPCQQAANTRMVVATGALEVAEGKAITLGVEALRNKIADQAAASRACASEITAAEMAAG